MRRRRRAGGAVPDGFGTSLADILMTALGCVLLMFMVAVTFIKRSLEAEQVEHGQTRAALEKRAEEVRLAEAAAREEEARRAAAQRALASASGARTAAERALGAAVDQASEAERRRAEAEARAQAAEEGLARAQGRLEALSGAARVAVQELDPHTARPVDVMLVVDGTRSMKASLDAARRDLASVVRALRVVSPTARVGVVVFRDRREAPELRLELEPLTGDIARLGAFLDGIEATSTAADTDLPEWLCGGLERAFESAWRPEAIRLVIVASDAASEDPKAEACLRGARAFREAGGQVHVLSTQPRGFRGTPGVRRHYRDEVLPQHARIAEVGGGVHVREAEAEALLVALLEAAFRSRTTAPVEALRRAVGED